MTSTHISRAPVPDLGVCEDYLRVQGHQRRTILKGMAAAGAAGVATSIFGEAVRQTAFADTTGNNVLVVLSLRGGMDGLGMVVPHAEPAYYAARPRLGVPKASLINPDATFGLHPDLAPIKWLWDGGEMAAIHAVGLSAPDRSHFDAMVQVEEADPASTTRTGWVNRLVGLEQIATPLGAVQLNADSPPTMLDGPAPSLTFNQASDLKVVGMYDGSGWGDRRRTALSTMWGPSSPYASTDLATGARSMIQVSDTMRAAGLMSDATPSVTYPSDWQSTDLAAALADTARLIRADVGAQVIAVDFGSWDMHSEYGDLTWGSMQRMVNSLAGCLDAFMRDLGALRSNVTVVTTSEFGRRVAENGNWGLDHGWGNVMLVLGGAVKGGKYYANWPGLGTASQVNGDLQATLDYRQVFAELVARTFPSLSLSTVFPGLSYAPIGFTRAYGTPAVPVA